MRVPGAILLALLALLAAAAATLWWFPAPLLATVLRLGGLETVRFADLRLGAGTLAIDDLQIGTPPAQRIARIRLHYRPLDLLRGRLASLEIAGLELRARLVDGRLELPGLPTPQDSDEPAALPALPWPEKIALRDSEIRLTTPWGELQAPLSAELLLDAGSAKLDLALADGALINDAGRLRADTTPESIWGTPEYQCRPHSAPHQWRGLGGARILKEQDPLTRDVSVYHIQFMRSLDRPIFMDGRPHPPAWAPHTWTGFSTGEWVGNTLKVTTTHLKDGYLRRGGPQTSDMYAKRVHYWPTTADR
jgi:hypothetical protein